jgi:hypothetical protein
MVPFTSTFKLYVRPDSQHKLSVRVSDWVCDTYLLTGELLQVLCTTWRHNQSGSTISDMGNDWFVQHKLIGTPQEYVRISVWQQGGCCRDYRVSAEDMEQLSEQWLLDQPLSTAAQGR